MYEGVMNAEAGQASEDHCPSSVMSQATRSGSTIAMVHER